MRRFGGDGVDGLAGRGAGSEGAFGGSKGGESVIPAVGQAAGHKEVVFAGRIGELGFVSGHEVLPLCLQLSAATNGLAAILEGFVGHVEGLLPGPAEVLLGQDDLVLAQGRAMGLGGIVLVGRAEAYDGVDDDEGRLVGDGLGLFDGGAEGVEVLDVGNMLDVPAVGFEALADVFAEGEVGVAVDGDGVVVVEVDELAQLEEARDGGGFGANAFHEVAVGAEGVGIVVYDGEAGLVEALGQPALGEGHTDTVAEALAERAGGGLDAGGIVVFGVAGGLAAPLAEVLEVVRAQRRSL